MPALLAMTMNAEGGTTTSMNQTLVKMMFGKYFSPMKTSPSVRKNRTILSLSPALVKTFQY